MRLVVHARHDDVAALHVAHVLPRRRVAASLSSTSFTHGPAALTSARARDFARARLRASSQRRAPEPALAPRRREPRAHADLGAARVRRHRVEHDQPRIVDARVGVDEALAEARLQARRPSGSPASSTPNERGSVIAPPEAVVEEQPGADHPRRPQVRLVRQHERERLDDVRRERSSTSRSASASAPAGTRSARGSAGRRGSAWCSTTTWRRRGRRCSTSSTDRPRPAASRAIPAPLMPPPMTRRS